LIYTMLEQLQGEAGRFSKEIEEMGAFGIRGVTFTKSTFFVG